MREKFSKSGPQLISEFPPCPPSSQLWLQFSGCTCCKGPPPHFNRSLSSLFFISPPLLSCLAPFGLSACSACKQTVDGRRSLLPGNISWKWCSASWRGAPPKHLRYTCSVDNPHCMAYWWEGVDVEHCKYIVEQYRTILDNIGERTGSAGCHQKRHTHHINLTLPFYKSWVRFG